MSSTRTSLFFFCFSFVFLCSLAAPATWLECNGPRGHGFAFTTDLTCTRFLGFHLAEFQCYHNHIVAAEFAFVSETDRTKFCAQNVNRSGLFTIAPEFILPDFAMGRITAPVVSDLMSGFFGETVMPNVSFVHKHTWYWEPLGSAFTQRNENAKYVWIPYPFNFLFHRITAPPDFDSFLRVDAQAPSTQRQYGYLVEFDLLNRYEAKLIASGSYTGTVGPIVTPGRNATSWPSVQFKVRNEIYPGPTKANGDGRDDFKAYCPDTNRPLWELCT